MSREHTQRPASTPAKGSSALKKPSPFRSGAATHWSEGNFVQRLNPEAASAPDAPSGGASLGAAGSPFPSAAAATPTGRGWVQPKLRINAPGDRFEQEADRVAEHVVGSTGGTSSRGVAPSDVSPSGAPPPIQRASSDAGPSLLQTSSLTGESGRPIPDATRGLFENRMGADFSGVRIHTGARAERASGEIGARAFTHGSNIYFGAGEYAPGTTDGRRLLAHELAHTVQQGRGEASGLQREGDPRFQRIPYLFSRPFTPSSDTVTLVALAIYKPFGLELEEAMKIAAVMYREGMWSNFNSLQDEAERKSGMIDYKRHSVSDVSPSMPEFDDHTMEDHWINLKATDVQEILNRIMELKYELRHTTIAQQPRNLVSVEDEDAMDRLDGNQALFEALRTYKKALRNAGSGYPAGKDLSTGNPNGDRDLNAAETTLGNELQGSVDYRDHAALNDDAERFRVLFRKQAVRTAARMLRENERLVYNESIRYASPNSPDLDLLYKLLLSHVPSHQQSTAERRFNMPVSTAQKSGGGGSYTEDHLKAKANLLGADVVMQFPILADPDITANDLIEAVSIGDQGGRGKLFDALRKTIDMRIRNIETVWEELEDSPDEVMKLSRVVDLAESEFGVTPGSVFDAIVRDDMETTKVNELRLALLTKGLSWTIGLAGGAATGIGKLVITGIGLAGSAYEGYQNYRAALFRQALGRTAFDRAKALADESGEDPSLFWFLVDIAQDILDSRILQEAYYALKARNVLKEVVHAGQISQGTIQSINEVGHALALRNPGFDVEKFLTTTTRSLDRVSKFRQYGQKGIALLEQLHDLDKMGKQILNGLSYIERASLTRYLVTGHEQLFRELLAMRDTNIIRQIAQMTAVSNEFYEGLVRLYNALDAEGGTTFRDVVAQLSLTRSNAPEGFIGSLYKAGVTPDEIHDVILKYLKEGKSAKAIVAPLASKVVERIKALPPGIPYEDKIDMVQGLPGYKRRPVERLLRGEEGARPILDFDPMKSDGDLHRVLTFEDYNVVRTAIRENPDARQLEREYSFQAIEALARTRGDVGAARRMLVAAHNFDASTLELLKAHGYTDINYLEGTARHPERGDVVHLNRNGLWVYDGKNSSGVVEYRVDTYGENTKRGSFSFFQAHHPIKDDFAKTLFGSVKEKAWASGARRYDSDLAPTILLRDSRVGSPHQLISAAQNARKPVTFSQEYDNMLNDLNAVGVPILYQQLIIRYVDVYFGARWEEITDNAERTRIFGHWRPKTLILTLP